MASWTECNRSCACHRVQAYDADVLYHAGYHQGDLECDIAKWPDEDWEVTVFRCPNPGGPVDVKVVVHAVLSQTSFDSEDEAAAWAQTWMNAWDG